MKVYLDHASTTPINKDAFEEMNNCMVNNFGNANSSHFFGRQAVSTVDYSREIIARTIGAKPKEIYFTSGGTESDNWALKGLFLANLGKKNKLVVSAIEHSAIIESAKTLSKWGAEVVFVYPDSDGKIDPAKVAEAVDENTFLVSVMYVNNETGVLNDVRLISKLIRAKGCLFHSDCVQATSCLPLNVDSLGVDLMTVSAHKIGGPKGIGFLYVRDGVEIRPLIEGGAQEAGLRGGTTNVPSTIGFASAVKHNFDTMTSRVDKLIALRDYFENKLTELGFDIVINGKNRVPSISNVTFKGVTATVLLTRLDLKGIAVSVGSACTAGSIDPSHVLIAMGLSEKDAHSSVRFSFGEENTFEELDYVIETLKEIIPLIKNKL